MDPVTGPDTGAELRIEPLTKADAERLADELLAMTRDAEWDDWEREHLLSQRPQKWQRSLLAVRDGRPVGWAVVSATDEGAHLHHIVVAPGQRSAGVGAALMAELLARTSPGVLTLKVHPDNHAAARFYERLGFVEQAPSASGYRVYRRPATHEELPA
jgi:ribosomal protein S18 acetylase RimI-like enzyme